MPRQPDDGDAPDECAEDATERLKVDLAYARFCKDFLASRFASLVTYQEQGDHPGASDEASPALRHAIDRAAIEAADRLRRIMANDMPDVFNTPFRLDFPGADPCQN